MASNSHDTVAHAWAHKTGKARNGFNIFYTGDTIYSYGTHFPIARHVKGVVLFTTQSYSTSTAKHKTIVWRACHHMKVFDVFDVMATRPAHHRENLEGMKYRFSQYLESATRRRLADYAEYDIKAAQNIATMYSEYAKTFGIRRKPLVIPDLETIKADMAARKVKQAKAARVAMAKREKAYAKECERIEREVIPAWRAGENVHIPYSYCGNAHLMRERCNANGLYYIETTGGARFPSTDARKAWPLLQRMKCSVERKGRDVVPTTRIKLGDFSIDSFSEHGVRAGCHFVKWGEVERMATELGL